MELDKFKRRIIRKVSQYLLDNKPKDELWQELLQLTGYDCQDLWLRMRTLTLMKIRRLDEAGDKVINVAPLARMNYSDWLLLDLVIVHEDVDLIEKMSDENKMLLLDLVLRNDVEGSQGEDLANAWTNVTFQYNVNGRQCSPMLIQRRWYQMKASARRSFYLFWYMYRGNARRLEMYKEYIPSRFHSEIARWYPQVITQPWVSWPELMQDKLLTMPDEFERKVKAKCAALRGQTIEMRNSADANADDDLDLVLVEPVFETIDLADDCSEHGSDKESNQMSEQQLSTNIVIKEEPQESTNVTTLSPAMLVEQLIERDTELLKYFLKDDNDAGDKESVRIVSELNNEVEETISPTVTETMVRKVPSNEAVNSKQDISANSINNKQDILENNISNRQDISENSISDKQDISENSISNRQEISENSISNKQNISENSILSNKQNISENSILSNKQDISENSISNKHDISENSISNNLSNSNFATNRINDSSDDDIEIIVEQDKSLPMQGSHVNTVNEVLNQEISLGKQSEIEFKSKQSGAEIKDEETNQLDTVSQIISDVVMEDYNLSIDDDDISLSNPESKITESSKQTEDVEIESEKLKNNSEIDTKLLMCTMVYTTRLDNMSVFRNSDLNNVCNKDILELAFIESKPTYKSNNHNKTVREEEADDDGESEYVDNPENIVSDIPEDLKIDLSNTIFQKPSAYKYNPIQFCKNPDFNTRLKRLTVGFTSLPRNRVLLKRLQPLTIDLNKAFEDKLINGTMYLKSRGSACNVDNTVIVSTSLQSTQNTTQHLSLTDETQDKVSAPIDNGELLKSRTQNLTDIDNICKMNQRVCTAEVSPMTTSGDSSCKPPVRLLSTPKVSSETLEHVNVSLNYNKTKINTTLESNKIKETDGSLVHAETITSKSKENCLSIVEGVNNKQKHIVSTTNLKKSLKSGPKSKMKLRHSYYYTPVRPSSLPWLKEPTSSTSKVSPSNESLLTVDTLYKMLCINSKTPITCTNGKNAKEKVLNEERHFNLRARLKYFENKKKQYKNNTKDGTVKEDVVKDTSKEVDIKGTSKKVELPKPTKSNLKVKPKVRIKTVENQCCWARIKLSYKNYRGKHKCPRICKCCCSYELARKTKWRLRDQYIEISDDDDMAVLTKNVEGSKGVKLPVQSTVNDYVTSVYNSDLNKSIVDSSRESKDIFLPDNSHGSHINVDQQSLIGEKSIMQKLLQKPKNNYSTQLTSRNSIGRRHKYIKLSKAEIAIQCDLENKSNLKQNKHADNVVEKNAHFENKGATTIVTNKFSRKTRPTHEFVLHDDKDKILHIKTTQKENLEARTPIFVGRNQILLTNGNSPESLQSVQNQMETKELPVLLPKGVHIVLLPNGHLTCALEQNTQLTPEEVMNLPDVLAAIKDQLPTQNQNITSENILTSNIDAGAVKDTEKYDTSSNFEIDTNTSSNSEKEEITIIHSNIDQIVDKDQMNEDNSLPSTRSHITSSPLKTKTDHLEETMQSLNSRKRPNILVRKKDIFFPMQESKSDKKNTLLSDLMVMSGISDEDVKSAPPRHTEEPVTTSPSSRPTPNITSPKKFLGLSSINSYAQLKIACQNQRKFYKLDLDTGYVTDIKVSFNKSDTTLTPNLVGTNEQSDMVIDLTEDVELEEINRHTVTFSDPKGKSLTTVFPFKLFKSSHILNNKNEMVPTVTMDNNKQHFKSNGKQIIQTIQRPSETFDGTIELGNSVYTLGDESATDSSDDEPLSIKSKRKKIEEETNQYLKQSDELVAPQNPMSSFGVQIDIMSDEDVDCILGV